LKVRVVEFDAGQAQRGAGSGFFFGIASPIVAVLQLYSLFEHPWKVGCLDPDPKWLTRNCTPL